MNKQPGPKTPPRGNRRNNKRKAKQTTEALESAIHEDEDSSYDKKDDLNSSAVN